MRANEDGTLSDFCRLQTLKLSACDTLVRISRGGDARPPAAASSIHRRIHRMSESRTAHGTKDRHCDRINHHSVIARRRQVLRGDREFRSHSHYRGSVPSGFRELRIAAISHLGKRRWPWLVARMAAADRQACKIRTDSSQLVDRSLYDRGERRPAQERAVVLMLTPISRADVGADPSSLRGEAHVHIFPSAVRAALAQHANYLPARSVSNEERAPRVADTGPGVRSRINRDKERTPGARA